MRWKNLQQALPDIQKRPGMFLNGNSIFDLQNFIKGFQLALDIHEIKLDGLFDNNVSFHDWVALKTQHYESTSGWANMLAKEYGEEVALDKFWEIFSEYQNREFRILKCAFPKSGKAWKNQIDPENWKEKSCAIRPYQVQIIKYTSITGFFLRFLDPLDQEIERQEYALNERSLGHRLLGLNLTSEDWQDYFE